MRIIREELYAAYADASIRTHAASGGVVSAILIHLLDQRIIDGALVSRISSSQNQIIAETNLARNPDEILKYSGSSYIDTPVLQKIRELRQIDGRYAVVMLPCQVRVFRSMVRHNPKLQNTFSPIISLFCRGTVISEFYNDYFNGINLPPNNVDTIKVKRQYVGGDVLVYHRDGKITRLPFLTFNSYRHAGFHAKRLCAWCTEHIGEDADISVGDIFSLEYRKKPIKYSAFSAHTDVGNDIMQCLVDSGHIVTEFVGWYKYKKEFAKVEAMSNTLASRFLAASLIGEPHPRQISDGGRFNVFHMLAWVLIYTSGRISRSPTGRRIIYKIPSLLIVLYSFVIKFLSKL